MKAILAVLLALALVAAGWGWRSAVAARAAAEAAQERADSLYAVAVDREAALDAVMAGENAVVAGLEAARDSAVARADRAERRRPAVIERVVAAAGPDSAVVRAAVEEVADSIEVHELQPLRLALAAADSIGAARGRQLDTALGAVAGLRAALEASRAEADVWEVAATPRLFGLHVEPLAAALIGLGAGLSLTLF